MESHPCTNRKDGAPGGRRIARIDPSGNVYYYQADQIGSTRVIATSTGTVCFDSDYSPYGAEMNHVNNCPQNYKFTGYERDTETSLDYAFNRYYNSRTGRFMSADPSGIASATLSNPQSLHRYAYVLNNPLIGIDLLGLECVLIDGDIQAVVPTVEDASPGENTNDWSTGTDSAGCAWAGGLYFQGNNEVNFDDPYSDGGNWDRFDMDPDSGWVSLTDDNGNPTGQFNCQGSDCGISALSTFASAEFGRSIWLYNNQSGVDRFNRMHPGQTNLRDFNPILWDARHDE